MRGRDLCCLIDVRTMKLKWKLYWRTQGRPALTYSVTSSALKASAVSQTKRSVEWSLRMHCYTHPGYSPTDPLPRTLCRSNCTVGLLPLDGAKVQGEWLQQAVLFSWFQHLTLLYLKEVIIICRNFSRSWQGQAYRLVQSIVTSHRATLSKSQKPSMLAYAVIRYDIPTIKTTLHQSVRVSVVALRPRDWNSYNETARKYWSVQLCERGPQLCY